jgi:hypothetical protein
MVISPSNNIAPPLTNVSGLKYKIVFIVSLYAVNKKVIFFQAKKIPGGTACLIGLPGS